MKPIIVEIVWFGNLIFTFRKLENITNPKREPKVKILKITKASCSRVQIEIKNQNK